MNRATLVSRPENSDDLRRKMLNTLLAVLVVLLAIVVVGCGDDDVGDVDERNRGTGTQTIGPSDTAGVGADMPGSSSMSGGAMEAQSVTVTLKDGEIAMPTIIKPGPTTFNVVNEGTKEHSLRLEGAGQETGLNSDLDPSQSASMEADLLPGAYTVRCPVDDHNEMLQMTVQP